jgi:hypothetical protein
MKLGIVLPNWGMSEVSYFALKQANELLEEGGVLDHSIIGFYESVAFPPVTPYFAMMQTYECYNFNGHLISANIHTTRKMLHCPGPSSKVYYIYDIEWFRYPQKRYQDFADIYRNEDLILIARCQDYADLIKNCYNRDVSDVVPDFNLKEIIQVINAENTRRKESSPSRIC